MSVNNIQNVTNANDKFYSKEKADVSFFEDKTPKELISKYSTNLIPSSTDYALRPEFFVPLDFVKSQIFSIYALLSEMKEDINFLLSSIFIRNDINLSLEESHKIMWKEVKKYNNVNEEDAPNYISFNQYKYAERTMSTSCRRMLEEYSRSISQASFAYLYDLRKIISFIQNEAINIRDILLNKFGEDYEDDTQKQVATQFDAWAKMASQFAQRVKQTITSPPGEIPLTELDKITKKQAVEFQAFFSIRLNALHEESQNIINILQRDYVDTSEIFYERYLSQAVQFTKDIVSSMELDFYTTSLSRDIPFLTDELLVATNVINANFGMVLTDLVQRNQLLNSNIDNLFRIIQTKRKYSNYIFQLSFKGQNKPVILTKVQEDKYSGIFESSYANFKTESDLISNHASLDNLEENHHPQYLLRDGGVISGNIFVQSNARIDGVHLSSHAHTGIDGSEKIKSTDIDYSSPREDENIKPIKPNSIEIIQYSTDLVDGGVPVVDGIIDIEIDDNMLVDSNEIIIQVIEI